MLVPDKIVLMQLFISYISPLVGILTLTNINFAINCNGLTFVVTFVFNFTNILSKKTLRAKAEHLYCMHYSTVLYLKQC